MRLAEAAESEGRPLDAVHEYQRAAELQPNEAHLFAWGADLLLHRAFEPAIEVFTKGHRLYPSSVRMLLGLSVATYDQGAMEEGKKLLLEACDLNPADPAPYLFLGRYCRPRKSSRLDGPRDSSGSPPASGKCAGALLLRGSPCPSTSPRLKPRHY